MALFRPLLAHCFHIYAIQFQVIVFHIRLFFWHDIRMADDDITTVYVIAVAVHVV